MMKDKHIAIILVIFIFLISILTLVYNTYKIYNNKIKYINEKILIYDKINDENNKVNDSISKLKNKNIENERLIEERNKKKDELEKIAYENQIKLNGKIVYLTFDDGPSIYTDEILNILDKYNVKATFFVVCNNKLEEYSKKIIEKGHTIGLHSCTHKYNKIYSSSDAYFNDLNLLSEIIEKSTGYKSKYVRFPGGSSNTVSKFNRGIMTILSKKLTDEGYRYYDWTIDSNDAGGANSEQIYSNVIGALENNDRTTHIILMHDTKLETKNALEMIIKDALKLGYTFSNINDYTKEVHHYINN